MYGLHLGAAARLGTLMTLNALRLLLLLKRLPVKYNGSGRVPAALQLHYPPRAKAQRTITTR